MQKIKVKSFTKLTLSRGNRKLKEGFLIWNLPAVQSCPEATTICQTKCYALKAEKMYRNVLPCRENNWSEAMKPEFVHNMVESIKSEITRYKKFSGYFRIHEAGDFFDQTYLNNWVEICSQFPDIKFLAFTKSFSLNYDLVPANLKVVFSIMEDTTANYPVVYHSGMKVEKPAAYAGDCFREKDRSEKRPLIECSGVCGPCLACWNLEDSGADVHFKIH